MKNLFILVALAMMSASTPTLARIPHYSTGMQQADRQLVNQVLQKQYEARRQSHATAKKTTSSYPAERLKAYSGYSITAGVPSQTDSGYFYFSGNNGSSFNYQATHYILTPYPAGTVAGGNMDGPVFFFYTGSYDYPEYSVMSDSELIWSRNCFDSTGVHYGFAGKTHFFYTGGLTDSSVSQDYTMNDYPYWQFSSRLFRDDSARVTSYLFLTRDTTAPWDTNGVDVFAYDAYGRLIADSAGHYSSSLAFIPTGVLTYEYDASGNRVASYRLYFDSTTSLWQPSSKMTLTYNSDNTLRADSGFYYDSSALVLFYSDSLGYTSGVDYYTYHRYTIYGSSPFSISQVMVDMKHVSAGGLPDTVYNNYYFGSPLKMQYAYKFPFTYDSYLNPVMATAISFNITDSLLGTGYYSPAICEAYYYYYEAYGTPAATQQPTQQERITVYPNPAHDEVTICRPDATQGSYSLVRLTDMSGKTLLTQSIQWTTESVNLPLGGLPSGSYVIAVEDNNGNMIASYKIIKQ